MSAFCKVEFNMQGCCFPSVLLEELNIILFITGEITSQFLFVSCTNYFILTERLLTVLTL